MDVAVTHQPLDVRRRFQGHGQINTNAVFTAISLGNLWRSWLGVDTISLPFLFLSGWEYLKNWCAAAGVRLNNDGVRLLCLLGE